MQQMLVLWRFKLTAKDDNEMEFKLEYKGIHNKSFCPDVVYVKKYNAQNAIIRN